MSVPKLKLRMEVHNLSKMLIEIIREGLKLWQNKFRKQFET
jgi:DNA-binding transcriptional regulator YiaG